MTQHTQKNKINNSLQKINHTVAGIDVGADSLFVCAGKVDGSTEVREFPTFTSDLQAMIQWLKQCGTTSVAMESTGVYWIPPYDMLEQADFEVLLTNAYYLKTVPGRKTDVNDCQWIQQLHSYGLLRGSFRPVGPCLILRGYVRQRSNLIEQASSQVNLMHKALSQMNIQLRQVVADIAGDTGMKIIRSIVKGERNPLILAQNRDSRCKASLQEIAKSLEGNWRPEMVFALQQAIEAYDFFRSQIIACEKYIEENIDAWNQHNQSDQLKELVNETTDTEKVVSKKKRSNKSGYSFDAESMLEKLLGVDLTDIPGLEANSVMKIISEIGTDMKKFPTAKQFVSWLGLCPGNKISGGKVLSSRSKPTANKAAQAFRMCAFTLSKSSTALGAFFRKVRSRLGAPKAITALAHKLAKIFYHMLRNRTQFYDIGQEEFNHRHEKQVLMNLQKRAAQLGFKLVKE